ncbi:hypothetical protein, partial [Streptomyces sp. NRRL F-6677]|uniref:hypothetical protein n=2 Tax=unclassified Streptomyces TaxID=2593676 RepID=UPI00055AD2E7
HLRPHAPHATLHTERFDPHADPTANPPGPGKLSGATTLIRADVRRIQVGNTWIRDYTLNLPTTGLTKEQRDTLNTRLTHLADTHLNHGLALPTSHDQFHLTVTLHNAPHHPETINLTHTTNPSRANQRHFDLNHSDADLLHELLHYLGLPDEQRDNDFLFRNHPHSTAVHTTGLMATTDNDHPFHIPHRYLETIENVTHATNTPLHDHTGQNTDTPALNPDKAPHPATEPPIWPTSQAP